MPQTSRGGVSGSEFQQNLLVPSVVFYHFPFPRTIGPFPESARTDTDPSINFKTAAPSMADSAGTAVLHLPLFLKPFCMIIAGLSTSVQTIKHSLIKAVFHVLPHLI